MFTVTTFDHWTDNVATLVDGGVAVHSAVLFAVSYIVVPRGPERRGGQGRDGGGYRASAL